jgi:hypothetical protein
VLLQPQSDPLRILEVHILRWLRFLDPQALQLLDTAGSERELLLVLVDVPLRRALRLLHLLRLLDRRLRRLRLRRWGLTVPLPGLQVPRELLTLMAWARLIEISIAGILLSAALSKAFRMQSFVHALRTYRFVPSARATAVGRAVVTSEGILGVLLASGQVDVWALAVVPRWVVHPGLLGG